MIVGELRPPRQPQEEPPSRRCANLDVEAGPSTPVAGRTIVRAGVTDEELVSQFHRPEGLWPGRVHPLADPSAILLALGVQAGGAPISPVRSAR